MVPVTRRSKPSLSGRKACVVMKMSVSSAGGTCRALRPEDGMRNGMMGWPLMRRDLRALEGIVMSNSCGC